MTYSPPRTTIVEVVVVTGCSPAVISVRTLIIACPPAERMLSTVV
jgi:hypothetical protein